MSKQIKAVLYSVALCIIGAILIDCGIKATGITFLGLGGFGIILGPLLMTLDDL